jgi:hypothetical protein
VINLRRSFSAERRPGLGPSRTMSPSLRQTRKIDKDVELK